MHFLCYAVKSVLIVLLDHHALGGSNPCDPLVVGIGDLGVYLSYLTVPLQDSVLEVNSQNCNTGNDQCNDQRQLPDQNKHNSKYTEHISQGPEHIDHSPGRHSCDPQGIAHNPGMDITHRSRIIIRKRKGLKMLKLCPF